jgi:iron complex transport system substrate-binding protein
MGLRWLSALLMPGEIELDLPAAVREFYALFYHVELSDEALADLLERVKGRP